MKKIFVILIISITLVIGLICILGQKTKFSYVENNSNYQNIEIINNSDFKLSLSCSPEMNNKNDSPIGLGVGLIFKNNEENVQIDSVTIKVMDYLNSPLELKSVSAVDGFYSWKDEYKSEAKSFAFLPEKFKTVNKDIEAYFVYSWHYDKLNKDVDLIKVIYKIHLSSNGEKYAVKNEIVFKLKSELIFRSPIRFH